MNMRVFLFVLVCSGLLFADGKGRLDVAPSEIRPDEFDFEKAPSLARKFGSLPKEKAEKLVKRLKEAAGNWRTLANALQKTEEERFKFLVEMLLLLEPLEAIETDEETLFDHLDAALKTREEVSWKFGEDDFCKYVLNPHILYAPLRRWRKSLLNGLRSLRKDGVKETAKAVNKWVAEKIELQKERISYCGWFKTPYEVFVSRCGGRYEIVGFVVGVLRSLGVAARPHDGGWVEFLDGKEWLPLYPLEPERFGDKTATEEAKREYAEKGRLLLTLVHKGAPAKGFKSFSVQRIGKKGYFEHVWYPDDPPGDDGKVEIELPPGEYRLLAGVRNRNGDPYIFHKKVKIESGERVSLTVELDIPHEDWTDEDWCVRKLKEIPAVVLRNLDGTASLDFADFVGRKKSLLVVFFRLEDEPCRRMLPLLLEWSKKNIDEALFVYIGEPDTHLTKFIKEQKVRARLLLISPKDAKEKFSLPFSKKAKRFRRLPQTLLFKDGRLRLWQEGFDMGLTKTLALSLKKD